MVAAGPNMRPSGIGIPSSKGLHISLYPVVRLAAIVGGFQKKAREVSDGIPFSNAPTG